LDNVIGVQRRTIRYPPTQAFEVTQMPQTTPQVVVTAFTSTYADDWSSK
jgi:hypothetical protein